MSRCSSTPERAKAIVGVLLFITLAGVAACDEDGKTAPDRCADPALPIFDIQAAGEPADDNAKYPCVTQVGHAINQIGTPNTGGVGTGGTGGTPAAAGKSNEAGNGGASTTDAGGAGGASSTTDAGGAGAGGA